MNKTHIIGIERWGKPTIYMADASLSWITFTMEGTEALTYTSKESADQDLQMIKDTFPSMPFVQEMTAFRSKFTGKKYN